MTRTMLIHASNRWPGCITANLWPYAMRQANEVLNNSPNMQNMLKKTPMELFTNTKVAVNTKHFQPFGCPVSVLNNELQLNNPYNKWKRRSNVGIYLRLSPQHSKNVALVMSRTTGLVSPQFHVKFDTMFDTVEQDKYSSQWQRKAGFTSENKIIERDKSTSQKGTKRKVSSTESGNPKANNAIPQQEGARRNVNAPPDDMDQQREAKSTSQQLQPESNNDSTVNSQKRLKTTWNRRQTKNSLKTQYGSTAMAKADGVDRDINLVQQPSTIEAMRTEIVQATKNEIKGEIMCLEAL